jgi:glycosyltransferase involved in cell wall biosynthesis
MLTTLHNELSGDTHFIWRNYEGWYNTISHHQLTTLPDLPRARSAGVVHNSIDVDSFPFRAEKDDYFLFIGRITPEKAPHLAVDAAKQVGARLIIAGKMSCDYEWHYFHEVLEPMIDGARVQFVGEADATLKRELYAGAQALLLPLQWEEPFGLVMIEAMACGTPTIVFPRGAAPELVVDGETGYLVQDVAEMVDAAKRLSAIDPWRCREHVADNFGPAILADRYLALYQNILGIKETVHDQVLA